MPQSVQVIPLIDLSVTFIPVLAVVGILFKWSLDYRGTLYAISRMLIQLLLIGYFLTYLFESDSAWIVMVIIFIMIAVSSWIALRTVKLQRRILTFTNGKTTGKKPALLKEGMRSPRPRGMFPAGYALFPEED